jgi:hypothetical protein
VDQTTKPITQLLGIPLDISEVLKVATNLTGGLGGTGSSGSPDFQNALQGVNAQGSLGTINDQAILHAHQQVYSGNMGAGVDANTVGAAAALQSLKSLVTGGTQGIFVLSYFTCSY